MYKLDDLLETSGGLPPGSAVVELGCWPGGWLQRLAARVGERGRVVGVDLRAVDPLAPPVELLELDFTEPGSAERIRGALGRPADAVLSDAAPKLTGIADLDRAACAELYEAAHAIALEVLGPRGFLIVKGFPSPEASAFRRALGASFAKVRELRPEGRRSSSKEVYWLARGPRDRPGS